MNDYLGKFRGIVVDNADPDSLGRLLVEVEGVADDLAQWATPCTPFAGPGVGFYAMPPIGASVWVEFERGNPNCPIWVGCYWVAQDVLQLPGPPRPEVKVFKTDFVTMTLSDLPETGGFSLRVGPPSAHHPLLMTIDSTGVTIVCSQSTIRIGPDAIALTVGGVEVATVPTVAVGKP